MVQAPNGTETAGELILKEYDNTVDRHKHAEKWLLMGEMVDHAGCKVLVDHPSWILRKEPNR